MITFEKWKNVRSALARYASDPTWLNRLVSYTVIRSTIEAWQFAEGRKIVKMLEWDGTDTPERIREVAGILDKAGR